MLPITEYLRDTRPPDVHPLWVAVARRCARARSPRSAATTRPGRRPRQELALARRIGAPWVVGRALRLLGELDGSVDVLEEAVALLAGSGARLEHAKAVAALARALARERPPRRGRRARGARPASSRCAAAPTAWRARSASGQWFET